MVTVLCALVSPGVGRAHPGDAPSAGTSTGGTTRSVAQSSLTVAKRPAWQVTSGVPRPGIPAEKQNSAASPALLACDTHAVGTWGHTDQAGVWRSQMNMQVQVRDHLTGALIVGLTDSVGHYDICFGAAQFTQLYLTFKAAVSAWRVQNGTDVYNWSTPIHANPVAGSTVNFGFLQPGTTADNRAAHAFDEANDAWLGTPHQNTCWDPKDTVCRQIQIDWANNRPTGVSYYDPTANIVHLVTAAPDARSDVVHEIGHAIMDDVYNDAFPTSTGCPMQHSPSVATTAVCAWTEGWADFFALAMYHSPIYVFTGGASFDFEGPTWGTQNFSDGDMTEGRVAGALFDLTDNSGTAEIWDQHAEGFGIPFYTLWHHVDTTFASFWRSRSTDGFDVSDSALGSLHQSTIDYQYRKPLIDGRGLVLPGPTPHNFAFNTVVHSWSVVALGPGSGVDFSLRMYDDRAQTSPNLLASSSSTNQPVDFVAIDSNLRPLGDYYPQVALPQGTVPVPYALEYVESVATLPPASSNTFHLGITQFAAVQDTDLTAGVPVTVTLTGTGAPANLYVMGDDPNAPSTFVQGRASAVASATAPPAGGPVTVTFTPTRTGRYGLVVTAAGGGNGDYTLTRS
ncbi:hypothetical protein [Streptomyces sp. NPDC050548]|uniref:hypothetical protein n=1 Tax=Streptomyces sp. NPDC050548 TaxID=3365629 RepID=UPI00378948A4